MRKFFKFISQALRLDPGIEIDGTVEIINTLNEQIRKATVDGEDKWHLCWTKDDVNCEEVNSNDE